MDKDAIIFDFDGTLIDSAPDLAHAMNRLMGELGEAEFDVPTIASYIGNGIPKLVERAMVRNELDMAAHAELTARFKMLYEEDPTARTIIFDNVMETLAALKSSGLKLALCTNKAASAANIILRDLNMAQYFDVVVGGDSTAHMKPDPLPLLTVLGELGVMPGAAVYVGDSHVDVATAKAAKIDFVYYTGGYDHAGNGAPDDVPSFGDFAEFFAVLGLARTKLS